jgi:arylsulfatase A-like enzyme
MHSRLAGWFKQRYDPRQPFFLFMNYIEAHQPYGPPPESLRFASRDMCRRWQSQDQGVRSLDYTLTGSDVLSSKEIAELEALYDDELCYLDRKIGEVLTFLKSTGLEENTLVVVTADHGEHFGEHHRMEHEYSIYQPLVRVPLIVRYHGQFEAGREEKLVQSHDVYPTILELTGIEGKQTPGQTCRSLLRPSSEPRYGISEYLVPMPSSLDRVSLNYPNVDCSRFNHRFHAIQRENLKLIRSSRFSYQLAHSFELYDVRNDPLETCNLADRQPEVTRELASALETWARSFDRYVASPMSHASRPQSASRSPNELKTMRGLGYIQ